MHFASLTFLLSLLATFALPTIAKKDGGTFCQQVDKLKVTSPLTFIRPVPSVNLKWDPKICLCQADGELTDNTVDQLQKKVKQEGVKKLAKKLGLDSLPASWEELFVQQAVLNAAEDFVSRQALTRKVKEECSRARPTPISLTSTRNAREVASTRKALSRRAARTARTVRLPSASFSGTRR